MDNFLQECRKNKNLTMEQLAEKVNTSKGQIWKLETGKVQLSQKWLELLSSALDCTPMQILYGKDYEASTSEKTPLELAKALEKTIASDDDLRPIMESFVKVLEERAKK